MGRYGRHLGRLWHVAEDIALLEDEERGAHLLARALTARPMLPVVMASDRDPEVGLLWARLVQAPTALGAEELAQRIVDARGLSGARQGVTRESWAARKALMVLDESRYRSALDRLARSLIVPG